MPEAISKMVRIRRAFGVLARRGAVHEMHPTWEKYYLDAATP